MTETKMKHHIEINIPDTGHGPDVELKIDGEPLLGVAALKVEAWADNSQLAKVTLTMHAIVSVNVDADTYREYTVNRNSGEYITDADRA